MVAVVVAAVVVPAGALADVGDGVESTYDSPSNALLTSSDEADPDLR